MKNIIYRISKVLALVAIAVLVSGCGKDDDASTTLATAVASGTCAAGYVYNSTYGCLPQGSCPSGYGIYNNQCLVGTVTTTTTTNSCQATCSSGYVRTAYGCLPQGGCASCYGYSNGWCFQGY